MATQEAPKLLTMKELSAHLSLGKRSIFNNIKRNGLPAIYLSKRSIRFDPARIKEWLDAKREGWHLDESGKLTMFHGGKPVEASK